MIESESPDEDSCEDELCPICNEAQCDCDDNEEDYGDVEEEEL
jgi:hypothetical protein